MGQALAYNVAREVPIPRGAYNYLARWDSIDGPFIEIKEPPHPGVPRCAAALS
jgi:hypothetical protein